MIVAWTYPGGFRCLRLLEQVPDLASRLGEPPRPEVLGGSHLKALSLLPHLLEHVLLALVVAVLAARLEVQLVDAPVLEVVGERQHAHLLDEVQLTGAVEIQHGRERSRVTIKVKLHRIQTATPIKSVYFRQKKTYHTNCGVSQQIALSVDFV